MTLRLLLSAALALPLVLGLTHCGKKETPANSQSSPSPASSPAPAVQAKQPSGLSLQADKLGFAGKLPVETELYVGSSNFKQHLESLKKTAFYKELFALANDKTPAPAAGDKSLAALQKLWGDELFVAGGAGMSQFAAWFQQFSRLYNELNFRMLMSGGAFNPAAASKGTVTGFNPAVLLQSLLADPAQLDRAGDIISKFQLPPGMMGFKAANPSEIIRDLIPDELLKKLPADKFTAGTFKTPDGSSFQTINTDGAKLFADELKQQLLGSLPPTFDEHARKAIEKALNDFQAKKFAFAWGAVGDYVVFAIGSNFDHLKFTPDAASSFLSRPELAPLEPYSQRDLLGLAYFSAGVLEGLVDDQPLTPMLRGVFGAMKENPMFSNLGATLERQLADYTPAEVALFKRQVTSQSAAFWWDHGLHLESFGGLRSGSFDLTKKLQFARFLDRPGVLIAFDYDRNMAFEKTQRDWMEKLFGMIYTGAQELIKAGIAGPQGGQSLAMFEGLVLPMLKKVYEADKELTEKGLGSEAALVVDVNGKMPSLPGIPIEAKDMKFPRITTLYDVANRSVVAESWKKINDAVGETIGIFAGGVSGTRDKSGNTAAPVPAPGFAMPDPISAEKNGVTTWFYGLPFFAGDLLPCASINDKLLLLSTSKDCAEGYAGELAKPAAKPVDGLVWKIDPSAIVDWAISASKLSPTQSPDSQKEMKQVQKWAKPFHAMNGRFFLENNVPRQSFAWEITDLVSFD